MSHPAGSYLPTIKDRGPSADAERLRHSVADWSAALAALSDLPSTVRQDVLDALELARRFNAEVVRPQALSIDQQAQDDPTLVPHELIRQAGEWGLFTLWLPSLFGGKGWNFISLFAFLEEVSSACVGVANVVGVHYMGVATLTASWNLRLAEQVLGEVCAGERRGVPCLISLALNEALAGTDTADTQLLDQGRPATLATMQADGSCVLQGGKNWVSNGPVSTWHMVLAYEDLARPSDTMVIVAVRADSPGLSQGPIMDKLGQKACPVGELVFTHCLVPQAHVALAPSLTRGLGRPHRDITQTLLDYILSCTRAGVAAFAAGTARGALEAARDHAARKLLPQGRLIEQQWAQGQLAEMSKNAQLARQAYLESALATGMGGLFRMMFFRPLYWADQLAPMGLWLMASRWILRSPLAARWFQKRFLVDQPAAWQQLTSGLASMAKLAGSELAMRNVALALDLCGPDALRHEAGLEKRLRDAKVLQIYEGTDELNRQNLFKCRVRPDEGVRIFQRDERPCAALHPPHRPLPLPAAVWPADGGDAWWQMADEAGRSPWLRAATALPRRPEQAALQHMLDAMHGLGWAALCGAPAWGGQGQPDAALARVLEALSAAHADAAAVVYASAAGHLALSLAQATPAWQAAQHDVAGDWIAWPAFHDIDEQLWPSLDAQGYLRGHVDMLLLGAHARWAVLPVQGADAGLCLALVDLAHPAVIRGAPLRTLGLPGSGSNDIELGGVPCVVLSHQGRRLWAAMQARLAPWRMAMLCGVARAALHEAQAHAGTREQGGGVLLGWPEVRRIVSLMHERLGAMQAQLLAGLQPTPAGSPGVRAPYAALQVGELACALVSDAVQILGAQAYQASHAQARRLRDVRQLHGLGGGVAWRRQGLLEQAWGVSSDQAS